MDPRALKYAKELEGLEADINQIKEQIQEKKLRIGDTIGFTYRERHYTLIRDE